jgi:hypothetical protein
MDCVFRHICQEKGNIPFVLNSRYNGECSHLTLYFPKGRFHNWFELNFGRNLSLVSNFSDSHWNYSHISEGYRFHLAIFCDLMMAKDQKIGCLPRLLRIVREEERLGLIKNTSFFFFNYFAFFIHFLNNLK